MQDPVVILGAARTPMGGFQGDFASLAAHDLGGAAIRAAVERSGIGILNEGMRISFETEPDKRGKGPKAVDLQQAS